jgi:hypothetical protein
MLDTESGEHAAVQITTPFGVAAQVATSSLEGCSQFNLFSSLRLSFCASGDRVNVSFSGQLNASVILEGELELRGLRAREGLALAYPIGRQRAAYTHKSAAMPGRHVQLRFRDAHTGLVIAQVTPCRPPIALLDYTRGMHRRLTHWFWVALTTWTAEGYVLGLQLSTGVYRDAQGHDLENVAWLDDQMLLVSSRLIWQGQPGHGELRVGHPWRLTSEDGAFNLVYVAVHEVHMVPLPHTTSPNRLSKLPGPQLTAHRPLTCLCCSAQTSGTHLDTLVAPFTSAV